MTISSEPVEVTTTAILGPEQFPLFTRHVNFDFPGEVGYPRTFVLPKMCFILSKSVFVLRKLNLNPCGASHEIGLGTYASDFG